MRCWGYALISPQKTEEIMYLGALYYAYTMHAGQQAVLRRRRSCSPCAASGVSFYQAQVAQGPTFGGLGRVSIHV